MVKEEPNLRAVTEKDLPEDVVLRLVSKGYREGRNQIDAGAVVDPNTIMNEGLMERAGYFKSDGNRGFVSPKVVIRAGKMCLSCRPLQAYASEAAAELHWQRRHSASGLEAARRDEQQELAREAADVQKREECRSREMPPLGRDRDQAPPPPPSPGDVYDPVEEARRHGERPRERVKAAERGPEAA